MSKIMNCSENDIVKSFKEANVMGVFISSPNKIEASKTTLKSLCEGSSKLLEEDSQFLKDIYGSD